MPTAQLKPRIDFKNNAMPTTYNNNILSVKPSGHGRYRVEIMHYRKPVAAEITDMQLIDRYKAVAANRDRGYKAVCQEIVDQVLESIKNQKRRRSHE